jgi:hypothetical protein
MEKLNSIVIIPLKKSKGEKYRISGEIFAEGCLQEGKDRGRPVGILSKLRHSVSKNQIVDI